MAEQILQGAYALRAAAVYQTDLTAISEHLFPVMGDPQRRALKVLQRLRQFQLQLAFQEAVQGGEGFIQQYGPGLRGQDTGQGCALLLSAGELSGAQLRGILQAKTAEQVSGAGMAASPVLDDSGDVLPDSHIGKQGILLEEIAGPPPLGRQVDSGGAVEEGDAVQLDSPFVWSHDSGDAPQRHGLSAAGGPKKG